MPWKAFIDGGSRGNPGPGGAGVQINNQTGELIFAGGYFLGRITNNQAEYQSLLKALDLVEQAGVVEITVFSDSELMVRQINGEYAVKSKPLKRLYDQARQKLEGFGKWEIKYIPRSQNREADKLANKTINAGKDVVFADTLGLAGRIINRPKTADRTESATGTSSVEVFVLKAPAQKQACPANIKRGQLFEFDKTIPAGFCIQACSSVTYAVLALQEAQDSLQSHESNMTVRCPKDQCGAIFEVRRSLSSD